MVERCHQLFGGTDHVWTLFTNSRIFLRQLLQSILESLPVDCTFNGHCVGKSCRMCIAGPRKCCGPWSYWKQEVGLLNLFSGATSSTAHRMMYSAHSMCTTHSMSIKWIIGWPSWLQHSTLQKVEAREPVADANDDLQLFAAMRGEKVPHVGYVHPNSEKGGQRAPLSLR